VKDHLNLKNIGETRALPDSSVSINQYLNNSPKRPILVYIIVCITNEIVSMTPSQRRAFIINAKTIGFTIAFAIVGTLLLITG